MGLNEIFGPMICVNTNAEEPLRRAEAFPWAINGAVQGLDVVPC